MLDTGTRVPDGIKPSGFEGELLDMRAVTCMRLDWADPEQRNQMW